jgi:hypothetical protein
MENIFLYSAQTTLFGHKDIVGFGSFKLCVMEIDRDKANEIIIKNHYSGKIYSATYIHLGVYSGADLLGVLQYGYAMNPASQASVVSNTEINEYLELNRMWISDKLGRNTESKVLSYSIKYIKRKYPKIKWIQSFADERCGGFGIVYQAANFNYYGEHKSDFWELDDVVYHNIQMTVSKDSARYAGAAKYLQENKDRAVRKNLRQFRYIYFIDKRTKRDCLHTEKPYPKHYKQLTGGAL